MPIDDHKQEYSYDNGFRPKNWDFKEGFVFYRHDFWYKVGRFFTFLFPATIIYTFMKMTHGGCKIYDKKKYKVAKDLCKNEGVVFICNHIDPLDALAPIYKMPHYKTYTPTIKTNMGFGIVSGWFRGIGLTPIPTKLQMMKEFDKASNELLGQGYSMLFFAEGELILYSGHIRPYQRGAFKYALQSHKKIVPVVLTLHCKRKGKKGKKPNYKVHYLDPYTITETDNSREDLMRTCSEINRICSEYFVLHSDYEWLDEEGIKLYNELKAQEN